MNMIKHIVLPHIKSFIYLKNRIQKERKKERSKEQKGMNINGET